MILTVSAMPLSPRPAPESATLGEEIANSISHGAGALLSIWALVWMIVVASPLSAWHVVGVSLFGASLVALYTTSCLYHSFSAVRPQLVFQILDHSFIFVLIAGSYMPWLLVNIRGPWGWSMFGIIIAIAVAGIVFKALFLPRYETAGAFFYIAMGLLILVPIQQIIEHTPPSGIAWLIAGGALYILGVAFFLMKRVPYAHLVWHLFVMAGSTCHVVAVFQGVLV